MVSKTKLANGITIVTEDLPQFRSCSLGLWQRTGSRFESPSEKGMSHFLEHMFFKGTSKRTAAVIAQDMDELGGNMNAFTEKEQTCFYARTMDEHLPLAMDVLSDMFLHSVLSPEEMDREKSVIIEEIKMCEDSPEDVVFEMFYSSLWQNHPLGEPVLGTSDTVRSFTRDDLLAYVSKHYTPSRLLVTAAGNLKHDMVVKSVEKWLENAPFSSALLRDDLSETVNLTPGYVPNPQKVKVVKYRKSEQVNICYGVQSVSAVDPRRYVMLVLDSVLGGSLSCRLFQEIREKRGLAYSVGTFQNTYSDCGNFGIYAGTSGENTDEVLRLSREILDDIRQNGITETELRRSKEHIKGSLALGMESTSSRMMRLARSETYHGRYIPIEDLIQSVNEVTNDAVMEVARTILAPENFTLVVLGPVKEADGVKAQ